jgi:pantoate--beta-alanine ligase
MTLEVVRTVADLRAAVAGWRAAGLRVALVPTMGALHAGHAALVREAHARAERVVVSIFVNPTQFGPGEDFASYPRREAADGAMLAGVGAHVLYAPSVEAMYPAGFSTTVTVGGVSGGLCGAQRPGHFDGVATVVTKLLLQCGPDIALFGEKDYQQVQVIRRAVRDLDLAVGIIGVPTVREDDGLAMSSRNAYLTAAERERAPALYRTLSAMAQRLASGEDFAVVHRWGMDRLGEAAFTRIDYLQLCDAQSLAPINRADRPARLLAAAHLGRARLIDNVAVDASA